MLVRNDQPTELDRRKALTGVRLALSQSLNSARSTDVAVPFYLLTGSAMDYSIIAITMRVRKLRTCQLGMSR